MIPEAAVEAAAKAWFERATGCDWNDESEQTRRGHRGDIRAAMTAAAPLFGQLAYECGRLDGYQQARKEGAK